MDDEWKTRETLIQRARNPDDREAWAEFVSYYESFIRMLLTKLNVRRDDINDLTQEILLKLWKSLPDVKHWRGDSKFRTWLGAVIRKTAFTHGTKRASRQRRELDASSDPVVPSDLDAIIDREWQEHLVALVIERLEKAFSGKAMAVFMMTMDGKTTDEIAETLELAKDSVYVLRNRVRSRFLKEAKQLQDRLEFRE